MAEYKSNSHRSKEQTSDKKVEKVISGKDKVKKINKISRRCIWLKLDNVTDLEDKFVPYQGRVPFED